MVAVIGLLGQFDTTGGVVSGVASGNSFVYGNK